METNTLTLLMASTILSLVLTFSSIGAQEQYEGSDLKVPQEIEKKIDLLIGKSQQYLAIKSDSSIIFANQAITLASKFNDTIRLSKAYSMRAYNYIVRERLYAARDSYLKALDLLPSRRNDSLTGEIQMMLGRVSLAYDSYHTSMKHLVRSLYIAENYDDTPLLNEVYLWIAVLYKLIGSNERAITYYNLALETAKSIDPEEKSPETLIKLAGLHQVMDEYEKAEELYLISLEAMNRERDSTWIGAILIELGNTKYELNQFDSAVSYYQKVLDITKNKNPNQFLLVKYYTASAYIHLASVYLKTKKYEDAKFYLKKALKIAEGRNYNRHVTDASLLLSEVYEQLGFEDSAFAYFKYHYHIKDSIYNALTISETVRVEMEYNLLRTMQENRLKRMKRELEYKQNIQIYRLLVIVGILLAVILLMFLLFFRYRQKNKSREQKIQQQKLFKEKDLLKEEVHAKDRELTTSVIYLLKKNNFLISLSESLKESINHNKHNNVKEYQDILKKISNSLSKDAWDEFETRFNNVHQSFNENLLRDFPDLTPNELKLCAFLRLNMTTKDIETITYQSANSIAVARHRLRSKLEIEREENLVAFLSKY